MMDGHGIYVWSVYLVAFVVLTWLGLAPLVSLKKLLRHLRHEKEDEAKSR